MTTYLGKSCSFGLPRVPFVNCRQFMYLVIFLLVLRAGCWIWLYQFLIIAYLFTLWTFKTAPLQRPQSALQFVQYQAPSPDSILKSSLSSRFELDAWKHFSHSSHSRRLSDAWQYLLHTPHWNLGPGFISISQARMIRINKLFPLRVWSYVVPQNVCDFQVS